MNYTTADNELIFCVLQSNFSGQETIKFVKDQMKAGKKGINALGEEDSGTYVLGSIAQTWAADYPLVAYNSYLLDNSQIFLANIAEKQNK